jgi:hypothetical protein
MTQHDHNQHLDDLRKRVTLTEPGRAGGLAEFMHALAAILARLDAERQGRVQSQVSPEPGEHPKEQQ